MTKEQLAQNEPLEGKVALILNERELAINIGSSHGVQPGMKFKVLAKQSIEIFDPETGGLLGAIDREKVRVQARELQERFSICRTYRTYHTPAGPLYDPFSTVSVKKLYAPPREVTETLKVDDLSRLPPLPEEQSYVEIGDRVVQLAEEAE